MPQPPPPPSQPPPEKSPTPPPKAARKDIDFAKALAREKERQKQPEISYGAYYAQYGMYYYGAEAAAPAQREAGGWQGARGSGGNGEEKEGGGA
jgi:hypothetical protein